MKHIKRRLTNKALQILIEQLNCLSINELMELLEKNDLDVSRARLRVEVGKWVKKK